MTTDPSAHDAGLCQACGCCCDGTFFARCRLEPAEVDLARRTGLRLAEDAESAMSLQPCVRHGGDHCAIYLDRPIACAIYSCALLERFERGEVSEPEALALIAQIREQASALRVALHADATPLLRACDAFVARTDTADERQAHGELLLRVLTFVHAARKHFGVRAGEVMS